MSLRISSAPTVAYRSLAAGDGRMARTLERLSSGHRINRAADDAAGLAISEGMSSQIRGMRRAERNVTDGISLLQVAEGALTETTAILQRQRDLAVQAASTGSNNRQSLSALQAEFTHLNAALDGIAENTNFNGIALLDGTFGVQSSSSSTGSVQTVASGVFDATQIHGDIQLLTFEQIAPNGTRSDLSHFTFYATGHIGATTGFTNDAAGAATLQEAMQRDIEASPVAGKLAVRVALADGGMRAFFTQTELGKGGVDGKVFLLSTIEHSTANDLNMPIGTYTSSLQTHDEGTTQRARVIQVGANAGETIPIAIHSGRGTGGFSASALGLQGLDLQAIAAAAISAIDTALSAVTGTRATLGATQNRFESIINNLGVAGENLAAAHSHIKDADFAVEMSSLSRQKILQESSMAMLSQANSRPRSVLTLLQSMN